MVELKKNVGSKIEDWNGSRTGARLTTGTGNRGTRSLVMRNRCRWREQDGEGSGEPMSRERRTGVDAVKQEESRQLNPVTQKMAI